MKRFLFLLLLTTASGNLSAQTSPVSTASMPSQPAAVLSHKLTVSHQMTVHVRFAHPVRYVDAGSAALLVGHAGEFTHILRLKAKSEQLSPTTLSAVTADGVFYSFMVSYQATPNALVVDFAGTASAALPDSLAARVVSQRVDSPVMPSSVQAGKWQQLSEQAATRKSGKLKQTRTQRMRFSLDGLFTQGEALLCKLSVKNSSPLAFTPEAIRFVIRDRRRLKHSVRQEREVIPHVGQVAAQPIGAGERLVATYVLPKLSLSKHQQLVVELTERDGGLSAGAGRHLQLCLSAKRLLWADAL